jgi:hypothetical protein
LIVNVISRSSSNKRVLALEQKKHSKSSTHQFPLLFNQARVTYPTLHHLLAFRSETKYLNQPYGEWGSRPPIDIILSSLTLSETLPYRSLVENQLIYSVSLVCCQLARHDHVVLRSYNYRTFNSFAIFSFHKPRRRGE